MWSSIKRLLRSEGGWMAAIPLVMSAIQMGMGASKNKQAAKLVHQSGEEKNLQNFTQDYLNQYRGDVGADKSTGQGIIGQGQQAAENGGLMPAISEAFSQRPNSSEYDAIANQEKNLKNQALNTGARGGLLKNQMFEAAKNAASNKLGVMENARQNALQRAFQIYQPQAPTQANDIARQQQLLGYDALASGNWNNLAKLGVDRNMAQLKGVSQDQAGTGSGLGSILGGLGGQGGGLDSLMGLFGGGGGSTAGATSAAGSAPYSIMGAGGWGGFSS